MTTLTDMTPEQRAQCVGMWATNHAYTGDGESVGVIACIQHHCVWLIHTDINGEWSVLPTDGVTPRYDLPRAWNPDGTPVEMDVETGIVRSHPRGGVIGSYESPWYVNQQEGTVMRRFVGEWEEE